MPVEVDATTSGQHALGGKPAYLFAERRTAGRECDAPVRAHHAVPRQLDARGRFREDPSDQTRAPRQAGAPRDFSVTGDAAPWDGGDHATDRSVFRCGFGSN